jgi:hypothetical protein
MIGMFDERLGAGSDIPGGEESDYIIRAYLTGTMIEYAPDIVVFRPVPGRPQLRRSAATDDELQQLDDKHQCQKWWRSIDRHFSNRRSHRGRHWALYRANPAFPAAANRAGVRCGRPDGPNRLLQCPAEFSDLESASRFGQPRRPNCRKLHLHRPSTFRWRQRLNLYRFQREFHADPNLTRTVAGGQACALAVEAPVSK